MNLPQANAGVSLDAKTAATDDSLRRGDRISVEHTRGIAGNTRGVTRPRGTRKSVDRALPASVLCQLRAAVKGPDGATSELVDRIDRELGIESRYGVSKRRLVNFLKKPIVSYRGTHCDATAKHPSTPRAARRTRKSTLSNPRAAEDKPLSRQQAKDASRRAAGVSTVNPTLEGPALVAFRQRQASVAAILDETFGRLAESDPELWERRAYLMLMGTVYERLAGGSADIPTDELIALAKALAENRRVEARSRDEKNESASPTTPTNGVLPDRFGDIVRQIYGTNYSTPGSKAVESRPCSDIANAGPS